MTLAPIEPERLHALWSVHSRNVWGLKPQKHDVRRVQRRRHNHNTTTPQHQPQLNQRGTTPSGRLIQGTIEDSDTKTGMYDASKPFDNVDPLNPRCWGPPRPLATCFIALKVTTAYQRGPLSGIATFLTPRHRPPQLDEY